MFILISEGLYINTDQIDKVEKSEKGEWLVTVKDKTYLVHKDYVKNLTDRLN